MRRLLLYLILLVAACAPTVVAARAIPSSPAAISPAVTP
jgi:hypothetical protein